MNTSPKVNSDSSKNFESEIENSTKYYKYISWFLVGFGLILIPILALLFLYKTGTIDRSYNINPSTFGTFGDIIGGLIGALWALAGIFLLYAAIDQSRGALKQNKKALDQNRKALEQNKEALELGRKTLTEYLTEVSYYKSEVTQQRKEIGFARKALEAQKFENTFFRLSNFHEHIITSMDFLNKKKSPTIKGVDCFHYLLEKIEKSKDKRKSYKKLYEKHKTDLNHFYNNAIQVLKYVKNFKFSSDVSIKNVKKQETDIPVDKKSNFEIIMNGLSKQNYADMFLSKLSTGEEEVLMLHVNFIGDKELEELLAFFEFNLKRNS